MQDLEINRESLGISPHRQVEVASRHPVHDGQNRMQHEAIAADAVNDYKNCAYGIYRITRT
jgi:hypothetical protein